MDENELGDVPQLNSALDGLNTEGNILEKLRTWPWSTETLTGFLAAIVFPIILLLIRMTLAFKCESPALVDALYERVVKSGYGGHKTPWDAFWGQRYAVVVDPDGNLVDLFAGLSE